MSDPTQKPTICLDFDGVVHQYRSPWQAATIIPDDVTDGFFEWAERAAPHFTIAIYSSRSKEPGGREAMMLWLHAQRKKWRLGGGKSETDNPVAFDFPAHKPPAVLYIDDRALRFDGDWSALDPVALLAFKPWNRGGLEAMTDAEVGRWFRAHVAPRVANGSPVQLTPGSSLFIGSRLYIFDSRHVEALIAAGLLL